MTVSPFTTNQDLDPHPVAGGVRDLPERRRRRGRRGRRDPDRPGRQLLHLGTCRRRWCSFWIASLTTRSLLPAPDLSARRPPRRDDPRRPPRPDLPAAGRTGRAALRRGAGEPSARTARRDPRRGAGPASTARSTARSRPATTRSCCGAGARRSAYADTSPAAGLPPQRVSGSPRPPDGSRPALAEVDAQPRRAVVVGAGVAGQSAARDLAAAGYEVVVLEATDRVGGKLRREQVAGVTVDVGAEAMLHRRAEGVDLARALGLEVEHPAIVSSRIWSRGALRPCHAR